MKYVHGHLDFRTKYLFIGRGYKYLGKATWSDDSNGGIIIPFAHYILIGLVNFVEVITSGFNLWYRLYESGVPVPV